MAADGNDDAFPRLTLKQEAFVRHYLETGNATESYRRAYNAANMSEACINVKACELLKSGKVAVRLHTLQERAAAKAVLSRAWIIEQLMDNAEKAKSAEDYTASNKALELLGKTDEMQMFIERQNVTSDNRHHHSAEPLSPFAEHLAEVLGSGAEVSPKGSLPH